MNKLLLHLMVVGLLLWGWCAPMTGQAQEESAYATGVEYEVRRRSSITSPNLLIGRLKPLMMKVLLSGLVFSARGALTNPC